MRDIANLGKRPREDGEKSPSRQYREGEKRRSDQEQRDASPSKRPRIDFATLPHQRYYEQQQNRMGKLDPTESYNQAGSSDYLRPIDHVKQPQTTLGEDLYILEQQTYEMQQNIQAMKKKYQAGLNNLVTRDFLMPLDQKQAIQDEARRQQQEAGPSRQGDPSSHSDHLELSTDDFEFGSIELRNPHDQTQVTSSQSFPEIRHPFAAHHPAEAQRANVRRQDQIEQRQSIAVQQHDVQDAGPSRQGNAPNKIPQSDLNTVPDEAHEQQQHDKGKSTIVPAMDEYLKRRNISAVYKDYLRSLSEKEQLEYLKRSEFVDHLDPSYHRFQTYVKEATEKSKMSRDVAINVAKKWFPDGYRVYKQLWKSETDINDS